MATTHSRPTTAYVYPPRANTSIPKEEAFEFYAKMGYFGQKKYNDTHIMLDYACDGTLTIWDRHKKTTLIPPALQQPLQDLGNLLRADHGPGRHLLDGGLLHNKHAAIKNTIAIWDILIRNDEHLLGTRYGERYQILETMSDNHSTHHVACHSDRYNHIIGTNPANQVYYDLGRKFCPDILGDRIIIPDTLPADKWQAAWDMLTRLNANYDQPLIEGLVFKNYQGRLEPGLKESNNSDWLSRCRVTTGRHVF